MASGPRLAWLTPVCEALLSLLFPLRWTGVYVPTLPPSLLMMTQTPVPFLIGMDSSLVCKLPRFCNPGEQPVPITVADLDTGAVAVLKLGGGRGPAL